MILCEFPLLCLPDTPAQLFAVIAGADQIHPVKFPKQLYLMVIHMLSVGCKPRNRNDFFPLLDRTDDHSGTSVGNDHLTFPEFIREAFSV